MATKVEVRIEKCSGESVQCAISAGGDRMCGNGLHNFNIGTDGGTNTSLTVTRNGGGSIKVVAVDKSLNAYIGSALKPKTVKKGSSVALPAKENRITIYEKPAK